MKLLNAKEAGTMLRVCTKTVMRLKDEGKLAFIQFAHGKSGSKILFKEEDVAAFIRNNRQRNTGTH